MNLCCNLYFFYILFYIFNNIKVTHIYVKNINYLIFFKFLIKLLLLYLFQFILYLLLFIIYYSLLFIYYYYNYFIIFYLVYTKLCIFFKMHTFFIRNFITNFLLQICNYLHQCAETSHGQIILYSIMNNVRKIITLYIYIFRNKNLH